MAVASASPIAVDSASSKSSMPRSSSSRSSVGATSTFTTPLNEIRPTSTSGSTACRRSSRAACWAAVKRSGSTSVAIIDSDTSNSTKMRPWLRSRSVVRSTGRAMATRPIASPASWRMATTWRRQPGRCGAISSSRSTCVNRTWATRRQRSTTTYAIASRGIASRSHNRPGARKSDVIGATCPADGLAAPAMDVRDDGAQPVVAGRQLDQLTSGTSQAAAPFVGPFRRELGEATLDRRGDAHLASRAGRRVDHLDESDRGDVETHAGPTP